MMYNVKSPETRVSFLQKPGRTKAVTNKWALILACCNLNHMMKFGIPEVFSNGTLQWLIYV